MKNFVVLIGLTVLAIAESASTKNEVADYEIDLQTGAEVEYIEKIVYAEDSATYEKSSRKDFEKATKKNYGNEKSRFTNEYLDETFRTLKATAYNLSIAKFKVPDTAFTVRIESGTTKDAIRFKAVNQVLVGLSSAKRFGDSSIIKKDFANPRLVSSFKAKDLVIDGRITYFGESLSSSSNTFFMDIEELNGRLELEIPANRSESLSVVSLKIFSPNRPYFVISRSYLRGNTSSIIREQIADKYHEILREDLGALILKPFKDAFNKILKPFNGSN